jgi:hypothetical protein
LVIFLPPKIVTFINIRVLFFIVTDYDVRFIIIIIIIIIISDSFSEWLASSLQLTANSVQSV